MAVLAAQALNSSSEIKFYHSPQISSIVFKRQRSSCLTPFQTQNALKLLLNKFLNKVKEILVTWGRTEPADS